MLCFACGAFSELELNSTASPNWLNGRLVMPIYEYRCVDCGSRDQRVAGLDDHTALCARCGGLMLRLDEDVFRPYFEEMAEPAPPDTKFKASL
jgi:putative FmdB family regulatory protein